MFILLKTTITPACSQSTAVRLTAITPAAWQSARHSVLQLEASGTAARSARRAASVTKATCSTAGAASCLRTVAATLMASTTRSVAKLHINSDRFSVVLIQLCKNSFGFICGIEPQTTFRVKAVFDEVFNYCHDVTCPVALLSLRKIHQ